jgi:hypothetical protein
LIKTDAEKRWTKVCPFATAFFIFVVGLLFPLHCKSLDFVDLFLSFRSDPHFIFLCGGRPPLGLQASLHGEEEERMLT